MQRGPSQPVLCQCSCLALYPGKVTVGLEERLKKLSSMEDIGTQLENGVPVKKEMLLSGDNVSREVASECKWLPSATHEVCHAE